MLLDQFIKFLRSPETYLTPIFSTLKNLLIWGFFIAILVVAVYFIYIYLTNRDKYKVELAPIQTQENVKKIIVKTDDKEINEVEKGIRNLILEFKPQTDIKNYNEKMFEFQLYQWLGAKLGKDSVKYQSRSKSGQPDIVVKNKYAVELIVTGSIRHVRGYMARFIGYGEEFSKVFIVVDDKNRKIQEYDRKEFEDRLNKFQKNKFEIILI